MSKRRFPLNKFPELLKNPPPNLDIMLYDKKKEGPTPHPGDDTVKKLTLLTLSQKLDALAEKMDARFNNLEKDINTRLDNVEKRLDNVDTRLDYIVKANNLKDSK